MGFLWGLLVFIGSYLIVGPILMIFYTTYNAKNKVYANKTLLFGFLLIAVYVVIWILILKFLMKHITWCSFGAVIGIVCAIVTFNKNKVQTLINIDTEKPYNNNQKGTDFLLDAISKDIYENGIDYISEENPIPYICQIMLYFDKKYVDVAIQAYNPNLNIKFKNYDGVEFSPLDFAAEINDVEIFKLLLNKGAMSANNYKLALLAIKQNSYNILSLFLSSRKFDINKSLTQVLDELQENDDNITLLDVAEMSNAHEKIIILLKEHGAKSILEMDEYVNNLQDITQRSFNVYAGKTEKFSVAEIASFAINLQSFREKLPDYVYKLAELKYEEYRNQNSVKEYNKIEFMLEIIRIQNEFSEIIGNKINPDGTI